MTIGDEKVVQRFEPRMIGIEDRPHEAGMYADLHGHYVLYSAYAELAADRDLWRSMATFEGKVSASVLDDLHTTQAQLSKEQEYRDEIAGHLAEANDQLAELRGKAVGLAEHYDWLFQTEQDDEISGRYIADELRTLAAADGGGQGG